MYSIKELFIYSQTLNVLYVEDDASLRTDMYELLSPLFKGVDLAEDGMNGLQKYNQSLYDLVITDINMPKMNGIEMVHNIREINPEQKTVAISAHNEGDILIDVIKAGVHSFILKPVIQKEMINVLYPVCRDAYTQNINIELIDALNEERDKLARQNRELQAKSNTIETKHKQLGDLLEKGEAKPKTALEEEYFSKDEDEGGENITLLNDDCCDLLEMFNDIPELIGSKRAMIENDGIKRICENLRRSSAIFMHYSPYVDIVAMSMAELSQAVSENSEQFLELVEYNSDGLLMLFDAVSSDMERYVERFSVESLAMKNSHHIHTPTALSIQQIIDLICPRDDDYGDMEMF